MKYKVLLTGNNKTIINEFFTYTDSEFESMTTSERYDDIVNHLAYIQPDVFVYCLFQERLDDLKRFANMERQISEHDIPLVIVGDAEECSKFEKMAPKMRPLVLQKPISAQAIARAIISMLKEKEEHAAIDESADKEGMPAEGISSEKEAATEEKPKKHILIVDDDSRVLRMLKTYLADRYELATAINGNVALKFLETKNTDLVLLDYEMPTENGAAVLEKIRANGKTKNLPVVFLTGVTKENKIKEVVNLNIQGYLIKPVDMEKLLSTIKGILG